MPWSKRNQWIVVGVVAAAVGVAATCFLHQSGAQNGTGHSQWRAESDTLVQRVEQLSSGGEVDAAASVLEVVLKRPDLVASGQGDRARMAVARAYLAAGRRDQALTQVQAIPWADKGPQIAAEIVGLELAVRWRGLFDDQQILVSGAVTPRTAPWPRRWIVARAWWPPKAVG
jgi:hypothetical protein